MDTLKRWAYKYFIQKYYIESIREAKEKGHQYALNDLQLISAGDWHVKPKEVIRMVDKGTRCLIGNEPITQNELTELKTEVIFLKKTRLWTLFQETVRQAAIDKAVLQSKNFEEVLSAKLMVHNLSVLKNIVDVIESIKLVDNSGKIR